MADENRIPVVFTIGLGIRGPIPPDVYETGIARVVVSYPKAVRMGDREYPLPSALATVLAVSWQEEAKSIEAAEKKLWDSDRSGLYKALTFANQLFGAYKLARPNFLFTKHLRTVGEADTLFYYSFIGGVAVGLNVSAPLEAFATAGERQTPFVAPGGMPLVVVDRTSYDPGGTTPEALKHLSGSTHPLGRRFIRCIELAEHGYYTEALVTSFAILDDTVQQSLLNLLQRKEISKPEKFLRVIKDERLRHYLGPLLKLLVGKSIDDFWSEASKAIEGLNKRRNDAMHAGFVADRTAALLALFISMNLLLSLERAGVLIADIPEELIKYSGILAEHQPQRPDWLKPAIDRSQGRS
jgi:hypothetical protein